MQTPETRVSLKCLKNNGEVTVADSRMNEEGRAAVDEVREMVMMGGEVKGKAGGDPLNGFYPDSDGKPLKYFKQKYDMICLMT